MVVELDLRICTSCGCLLGFFYGEPAHFCPAGPNYTTEKVQLKIGTRDGKVVLCIDE